MFYTEHSRRPPILMTRRNEFFRSYHSLIFCYVFWKCYNYTTEKPRNMGTLWILCLKSLRDQYEQLTEAHWGTAEVQRASKRQSPLFKEDAMNLSYQSNWNILHKFKKPLCGDTSGYTSALWVRSFLYMVQQYPHHTKNKSPWLFCYKFEYALSLFYHSFKDAWIFSLENSKDLFIN